MEDMKKYELEEDELTDDELDIIVAGVPPEVRLEQLYNELKNPIHANNKEELKTILASIKFFENMKNYNRFGPNNNESHYDSLKNRNR